MSTHQTPTNQPTPNGWKIFGITIIAIATIALILWLLKTLLFPSQLKPVTLSQKETITLNQKLDYLDLPLVVTDETASTVTALEPEAYSEANATREISFSEREINAMIAHNTDMGDKLAVDLSDDLASAKLLMPLDPDMPVFGGKTLHLNAGIELAFKQGKPIVKIRGVSAWGVPVPNAWLGNMKNVDLVSEFGDSGGFWQGFAEGIEWIKVSDGKLIVKLKP